MGRDSRPNCILKQELCRNEPRSRFPKKSPFRAHFRAFYPHPAHGSSLRVSRGSCGMPALRRCPLANWPRISVGNWAPPPKEQKGPPTFWHQGNVVVPFRLQHASRLTPHDRRGPPSMPRAELGIHRPESWGRNWSRKVRETRSSSSQKRSERGQEVLAAR